MATGMSNLRDSEVVASIVAGQPSGLAEAYDRYAAILYTYCCTLLHEPADAADAVQDTFVIASSRLAGLRDPERLRAWLFAVARNECLRRLRDRQSTSAFDEGADVTDETVDVGGDAERAELRALLRAAIQGLGDADRDVIVLQLSHGLDAAEIAGVLGVSRNHAHALLSRAREHLQACIGALLVGRAGRRDCAQLNELLASWDGHLTVLVRKRVSRHIGQCDTCSARQRAELRPAMLLGLAGGPALLGAAAGVRHAQQAATLTAAARRTVLRAATGKTPTAAARQAAVTGRAVRSGRHGFPRPQHRPGYGPWGTSRGHLVAAAAGTTAVAAAVAVFAAVAGGPAPGGLADRAGGGPVASSPAVTPAAGGSAPGPASPGARPAPGRAPSSAPGSAPGQGGGGFPTAGTSPGAPAPPGQPASSPATAPSATTPPSVPATTVPATTPPPATVPPTTRPPAPGPSTSPPPSRPPATQPPPAPGTISVSPATVVLTPLLGRSFTITAHGGPVSWSIAEPASLIGKVSVSQSAGTLQAGQSATVTITTSLASLDSRITVSPGGLQVAVVVGLL
jgi:RNA polymerase sigma factor (sigma-70 family)